MKKKERMSKAARQALNNEVALLFSLGLGNGDAQIVTNYRQGVLEIAPVVAPFTHNKAFNESDKPQFSLITESRGVLVAGIEDVSIWGETDSRLRPNSEERYTTQVYYDLMRILLLHGFECLAKGYDTVLRPYGIITVPHSIYNDDSILSEMKHLLFDDVHIIRDVQGRELQIELTEDQVLIKPESAHDLFYWAFNGKTPRPNTSLRGTAFVTDIGFWSTQFRVFENGIDRPAEAGTLKNMGMKVIVDRVALAVEKKHRGVDISYLDRAMREIAFVPLGQAKDVQVQPGIYMDIAPVYDRAIIWLADSIVQAAQSRYQQRFRIALVTGGGAYHLTRHIADRLPADTYDVISNPEMAGVLGAFDRLKTQHDIV